MGLPQDFQEIVYRSEDTAVSKACLCLDNIIRLLKLKHSAIILHSATLVLQLLPAVLSSSAPAGSCPHGCGHHE